MKLSLSNWGTQNTPIPVQLVGNICLIFALVGGAIVFIQAQLVSSVPPSTLPHFVIMLGVWFSALGALGKFVSKFAGANKPDEIQKLTEKTNEQTMKLVEPPIKEA